MEVATIELAVESVRQGAFDFLTKPFHPVRTTARRAAEHAQFLRDNVPSGHARTDTRDSRTICRREALVAGSFQVEQSKLGATRKGNLYYAKAY